MASIDDRWYAERTRPDGSVRKERTARYGTGKRWLLRWRDEANEPHAKAFAKKADADRAKIDIEAALSRGDYRDPAAGKVTFRAYAERWRTTQFDDPNTAAQVEVRLRLHVYPALGKIPLAKINPSTIRDWVHSLTVARSYQETLFKNVSQILTAAVADDMISKNPCRSPTVRKPKPDARKVVPWTSEWVAGVRDALPDRYQVVALLGAGAGLRQGEMFGLAPGDVDFDAETITIRRQIKLSYGNRPYFALPKGRKTREVPLPPSLREAIEAYLDVFSPRAVTLPWDLPTGNPITTALILTGRESTALNRNYFNSHIWKPALAAVGIPTTRDNGCHALRHFYASVLLDGGESIKTVSERLGHSDPAFTLRTYTHLMPTGESRTKAVIDAAFNRLGSRPPSRRSPGVHQSR
jgi:integrase